MAAIVNPTTLTTGDTFLVVVGHAPVPFADGQAGILDRVTGTIYVRPDVADDAERVGNVISDALRKVAEQQRPTLTAVEGGGRSTKYRAQLRLV